MYSTVLAHRRIAFLAGIDGENFRIASVRHRVRIRLYPQSEKKRKGKFQKKREIQECTDVSSGGTNVNSHPEKIIYDEYLLGTWLLIDFRARDRSGWIDDLPFFPSPLFPFEGATKNKGIWLLKLKRINCYIRQHLTTNSTQNSTRKVLKRVWFRLSIIDFRNMSEYVFIYIYHDTIFYDAVLYLSNRLLVDAWILTRIYKKRREVLSESWGWS